MLTPEPIWIGGRETGELCHDAWNGVFRRFTSTLECRAASDLALLVGFLCDTVVMVHAGKFDRRRSRCVSKSAALTTMYRKRVFGRLEGHWA